MTDKHGGGRSRKGFMLFLAAIAAVAVLARADRMPRAIAESNSSNTTVVQQSISPLGGWQHESSTSALTDVQSTYWELTAEHRQPDAIDRLAFPKMLVMCHENETRILFNFNDYMGREDPRIRYRVDGGPIRSARASVSEGGEFIGYWNGQGIPLLKILAQSKSLVVSAAPYNEGEREAVFDLTGIAEVVTDVRKICRW